MRRDVSRGREVGPKYRGSLNAMHSPGLGPTSRGQGGPVEDLRPRGTRLCLVRTYREGRLSTERFSHGKEPGEAEPLPPTSCLVRHAPHPPCSSLGWVPCVSPALGPEGGGADRDARHAGSGSSGRECEELMFLFSMPAASRPACY